MYSLKTLRAELQALADPRQKEVLQRFFKTGPGEYGAGDVFLGIKVPSLRKLAGKYRALPLETVPEVLRSEFHEQRMFALLLLVRRYADGDEAARERVFDVYTAHADYVNNWDLVDLSAPAIVGAHLLERPKDLLYAYADSPDMWRRRIAMVATLAFIRAARFEDTLRLAERLLDDRHDLIHKAAGWMLREVGKRDQARLETFLREHCRHMPRTMLRYAIERLTGERRGFYLRCGKAAPEERGRRAASAGKG